MAVEIITKEKLVKMKEFKPSQKAVDDIKEAIRGLGRALHRHRCVAYVDMVCGELHVFKHKRGTEMVILDRDDGDQPDKTHCLGAYLSLPVEGTLNAEHDIVWAQKAE